MFDIEKENIKLKKNLEEYLILYGEYYPDGAVDYIRQHFLAESTEFDIVDIMNQVYLATGTYDVYPFNPYLKILREIKNSFDINRDLLEVGSGFYPAMATIIDKNQKKGSITGMDYDAVTSDVGRVKVIKDTFTVDTDVSKYQMLYGVCPCEATIPMIKSANKNDIDLFIGLCDCIHFEPEQLPIYHLPDYAMLQQWYSYVEEVLESTLPKDRKYEIYTTNDIDLPIIKTYK